MNEPIRIDLQFEPQPPTVTHQEKKFGGVTKSGTPIFYPTPQLAGARALLTAKLRRFAPKKPWKCPVQLTTLWVFRRPKSQRSLFKTTRPDTDNLQKMLKDVMTECGFWTDDALVVRENIEKIWLPAEDRHGIIISVIDLTDENKEYRK